MSDRRHIIIGGDVVESITCLFPPEIAGALLAGWEEVWGIERDPEYNEWAEARIEAAAYSPSSPFLHLVAPAPPAPPLAQAPTSSS